ncbi:MAG TPA: ABC transporter permease [Candidatus Limnocylindrales bacterium]|nr:ABC transporter permease [Candidatus Limnocylindrales bacterium]
MELLNEVVAWFTDPSNWTGTSGIVNRTVEHVVLSLASVIAAILIAVPAGLFIGHTGRGAFITVTVANLGRSIPSYALLIIFVTWFGIGFAAAFPALVVLALPPILTNTYVGLREVDRDTVEAGRAMGMRETQLLRRVEVPIALPVIVSGVRVAAVQVVATATLAALVGGGGLGRFIVDGFALRRQDMLVAGAILVAVLALLTERSLTFLEGRVVSPGLRPTVPVETEILNLPRPVASGP